ncbi:MAG: glycosyltransferase family 2 protein [Gemmataceae bacterium]|nr:glycosyltransferase family 2 protein [Gemmataceae bacterium]
MPQSIGNFVLGQSGRSAPMVDRAPVFPLDKNKPSTPMGRTRASKPATLALSILIVNYRQWKWTEHLVRKLGQHRLFQTGRGEILIIDNNSPRHPAIRKLRSKPHVSLLRWSRNRGFAKAVNEGSRLARGEWILVLNPDTTPLGNFLDQIEKAIEEWSNADSRVGLVGFGLRNEDGTRQGSAGPFPTFLGTLARRFLPRAFRKYTLMEKETPHPVDWVTGCCMLARKKCLEELRFLDPSFFLYYEDVDLCKRAWDAGWQVWHAPGIEMVHHSPIHMRRVPPRLKVITRQALMTYAMKHWGKKEARWMCKIIRWEGVARALLARFRGDAREEKWFARLARYARLMSIGSNTMARGEFMAALDESIT